jgi:hypothetical protein
MPILLQIWLLLWLIWLILQLLLQWLIWLLLLQWLIWLIWLLLTQDLLLTHFYVNLTLVSRSKLKRERKKIE